jgi:hypothetical protein
VLDNVSVLGLR